MANSTAITLSFKENILRSNHNLNTHTIKGALYYASGSLSSATTGYVGTSEVPNGSGYTTGGLAITAGTVASSGTTAYWQPGGSLQWTNLTIGTAFDAVLFYNTNFSPANAIAVFNFGSTTVNNGTFTINMPTNNSTSALIRLN